MNNLFSQSVIVLALSVSCIGCGTPASVDTVGTHDVLSPTESQESGWDPSIIDGGEMFTDTARFEQYVRRSTLIAKGPLASWDAASKTGRVVIDQILLGNGHLGDTTFVYDGGFVSVEAGDEVMILLREEGGINKLNSLCGASGLTPWTAALERVVRSAILR